MMADGNKNTIGNWQLIISNSQTIFSYVVSEKESGKDKITGFEYCVSNLACCPLLIELHDQLTSLYASTAIP